MLKYFGTVIMGGLGNKLFQIAQMIAFTKKNGYQPKIHPDFVKISHHTHQDWSYFIRNIPQEPYEYVKVNEPGNTPGVYFDYMRLIPSSDSNIVTEGYYQSEKFFEDFKEDIYQQFRCPDETVSQLLEKHPDISNSYFIHIRRGDYVNNSFHFVDLTRYYEKCLSKLDPNSHYYIFSDDTEFCKTYMPLQNLSHKTYINYDEITSFWLMSLCKGGICANSSYSWWASWLLTYRNPEGIIYYPNKQFPHNIVAYDDLHPPQFNIESVD